MECPNCKMELKPGIAIAPIEDSNEKIHLKIYTCNNEKCIKYLHPFSKILGKEEPAEISDYKMMPL